jgi:hypothetical protein
MHIMHGQSEAVPGMTGLTRPGDLRALPVVGGEGGGTSACCSSEAITKSAVRYRGCCKAAQGSVDFFDVEIET